MKSIRKFTIMSIFAMTLIIILTTHTTVAEEKVPVKVAKEVIEKHISTLSPQSVYYESWENVNVRHKRNLYDTNDEVIAYYFQLENKDTYRGYYIVSAQYNITPILEYSDSPSHEVFESKGKNNRIYYFGAENYAFAMNKKELALQFVERKQNRVNQLKEKRNELEKNSNKNRETIFEVDNEINKIQQTNIDTLDIERDSSARNEWEAYINYSADISKTSKTVTASSLESDNIMTASSLPSEGYVPVPHAYQYHENIIGPASACGPATAAMISQYFESIGHNVDGISAVNESNVTDESMAELTNYIRTGPWMYVGPGGIGASAFQTGFQNYLNDNYLYSNPWNVSIIYGTNTYALDTLKSRVVSSKPPALMWYKFPWFEAAENWHWTAVTSYHINPITWRTEITLKDPSVSGTGNKTFEWITNKEDLLFLRII